MIAARRLGMPDTAIRTHAGVLAHMKYTVKTSYGVSTMFIQSMIDAMLFGTGQGSGASPAVWLTLSVVLLNSLRQLAPRGMRFTNPAQSITVERHSDAFVDDAQNGLNDVGKAEPWDLQTLQSNLQQMSQTWERLLLPHLTPVSKMLIEPLQLTSGWSKDSTLIRQQDVTEAHKTLGVFITPTGDESAQVRALLEKSCHISNLVLSSNFSRIETLTAYCTMWFPAVIYSLGMTTMSSLQLKSIQRTATQSFLAKMGVNRNFPRAATFGPSEFGGLAFPDLSTEQGIQQIRTFMENVFHNTESGKLLKICLQTLQVEAGSCIQLLQEPSVELSYLTPCWLTSLRMFMGRNQLPLQMSENWNFFISRTRCFLDGHISPEWFLFFQGYDTSECGETISPGCYHR